MDNTKIRIDATDVKTYEGKPTDFFLCHTPLITDNKGQEVTYVLQNEWPFTMFQVLEFENSEKALQFSSTAPGNNVPCLVVENIVLRMSGALASVNYPDTQLSPQEVAEHLQNIIPKAGHWYKCVVLHPNK